VKEWKKISLVPVQLNKTWQNVACQSRFSRAIFNFALNFTFFPPLKNWKKFKIVRWN